MQRAENTSASAQETQGQEGIDQEVVEQLKKSSKIIQHLTPVIVNQEGKILSGRHRKLADPNWPTILKETKDRKEELLVTIHSNVQRRVPAEETQAKVLELTKILEDEGANKEDIASKLTEILPYSERHIRRLLPDEYKQVKHRPKEPDICPVGKSGDPEQKELKTSNPQRPIFDERGKLLPEVTEEMVIEAFKRSEITAAQLSEAGVQLREREMERKKKAVEEARVKAKGMLKLYEKSKLREAPNAIYTCDVCGRQYYVYHLGTRMREWHKTIKVSD